MTWLIPIPLATGPRLRQPATAARVCPAATPPRPVPAPPVPCALLQRRGFRPYVVQLRRKEWFKVSRALLSGGYYKSRLTTDPGYTW